jgi:hypothetical protein
MKSYKSILLENAGYEAEVYYRKMRSMIQDKERKLKELYNDGLRQMIIEYLKKYGTNDKWHILYMEPYVIEYYYNIKGGYTKGLIFGIYLSSKDEPVLMVDCLDGGNYFGVALDDIVDTPHKMFRLRNNVLIDGYVLYNIIENGNVAEIISKDQSRKMRKDYVDNFNSDTGKMIDQLKEMLKRNKYDEFIDILRKFIEEHGEGSKNKYINLKRVGRFWNCYISQLSLVNGKVWATVYKQGDLSDDEEDVELLKLLRNSRTTLMYKGESFIVDRESIEDMIVDFEEYAKNVK